MPAQSRGKTVPPFDHDAISAVTLDLVEVKPDDGPHPDTGPGTVAVPNRVFLNGAEWWVPDGAKFHVGLQADGAAAVEVTMTFYARRVRVGFADELLTDD